MAAIPFEVGGRSTSEALPFHTPQELVTRASGIHVHGGRLSRCRGDEWSVRGEGLCQLRSGERLGESGTFLLSFLLGLTLSKPYIQVCGHRGELVEGVYGTRGTNQLIFDVRGQVVVEAISEVDRGVDDACHDFFKFSSVLGNRQFVLPKDSQVLFCIDSFVNGLESSFELLAKRVPAVIE